MGADLAAEVAPLAILSRPHGGEFAGDRQRESAPSRERHTSGAIGDAGHMTAWQGQAPAWHAAEEGE